MGNIKNKLTRRKTTITKDFSHGGAAVIASVAIAGQAFPGLSSVLHSNLFRKALLVDLHFWHSCDNTVYRLLENKTKATTRLWEGTEEIKTDHAER